MATDWSPIHDRDPILHQAAYIGDLKKVKSLLDDKKQQTTINTENRLGCTPLRLAATAGNVKCVSHLIKNGSDVNVADMKAQTPLFVAVKNKHLECIKVLLQNNANPNGDLQSLCTPLYIAAMDGFVEGVTELVKYKADIDRSQITMGTFISTPLYISIAYHHFDCFKVLLRAGADPDFNVKQMERMRHLPSCQSLYHAVVRHNTDVDYAQLLYDCGACLYTRDDKNRMASEMNTKNECEQYISHLMVTPRSLASWCRIQIRRYIGRQRLPQIDSLSQLPDKLQLYLGHQT